MKVRMRYEPAPEERSRQRADDLCAWLRDYGDRRIHPRLTDERRCVQPHVLLDFGNQGLMGIGVEERHAGLALRSRDVARVLEQAAAIDLDVATFLLVCLYPGVRPIAAFGSERLRDEVLPDLARGRVLAGYAQTEAEAGTWFQNMGATARRGSDGWRISGDKVWIGNASWAGILTVMAHEVDEAGHRKGLAAVALRTEQPGVRFGRELLSMGMRGVVQAEIGFRDAHARPFELLGEREDALAVGVDSMSWSRFAIAATCIGAMKRAAQLMLRFGERRAIATGRLLDHPRTAVSLASAAAQIAACDALLYRIAESLDADEGVPVAVLAVAKVVASEFCWEVTDRMVQTLGSRGYDEANLAPQMLRDARVTRIFEGATEPLQAFVGSQAVHGRSDLHRYLVESLGARELSEQLVEAVAALRERDLPREWQLIQAGQLACWSLLAAALAERRQRAGDAETSLALDYCVERLARAMTEAGEGSPDDLLVAQGGEAEKAIRGYRDGVGVPEPTPLGEKHDFDPLLRRTPPDA